MKVYAARSNNFIISVPVDGKTINISFNIGIPAESLKCANIKDVKVQQALEACSCFGSEFWILEEIPDEVTEINKIETITEEIPEEVIHTESSSNDYPEVTNGQKAKLLLLKLIPGSTHAEYNTTAKIREAAKTIHVTFSNWNSNG